MAEMAADAFRLSLMGCTTLAFMFVLWDLVCAYDCINWGMCA